MDDMQRFTAVWKQLDRRSLRSYRSGSFQGDEEEAATVKDESLSLLIRLRPLIRLSSSVSSSSPHVTDEPCPLFTSKRPNFYTSVLKQTSLTHSSLLLLIVFTLFFIYLCIQRMLLSRVPGNMLHEYCKFYLKERKKEKEKPF